jgi:hypothetical protein
MTKPKKSKAGKMTANEINAKQSAHARAWEVNFGLPHMSILTREELLAKDHDIGKWITAEQADGFADERTLPHGLYFVDIDTALRICLQTGHPDCHYAMVLGWYWDSFTQEEINEGTHSTPEWDDIEDGESMFSDSKEYSSNGMPCWNEGIWDRFESHARLGYMGLDIPLKAPDFNVMHELDQLKKLTLKMADPFEGDLQDQPEQLWHVHFLVCRIKRLLTGASINLPR